MLTVSNLFILTLCLCWAFVTVQGFSLAMASRGYSLVLLHRLLIAVASLVTEHRLVDSGVVAHRPSSLQHAGSSWTKDQTHVPCAGKQTVHLWATREAPTSPYL